MAIKNNFFAASLRVQSKQIHHQSNKKKSGPVSMRSHQKLIMTKKREDYNVIYLNSIFGFPSNEANVCSGELEMFWIFFVVEHFELASNLLAYN